MFDYLKACYGTLVIPKLAKGVRMDGQRIIKISGQGSVYIRCLEPLVEEDKDEEDEELLDPAYAHQDDLSSNLVVPIPPTPQQPVCEPVPLDLEDPLLVINEEIPNFLTYGMSNLMKMEIVMKHYQLQHQILRKCRQK